MAKRFSLQWYFEAFERAIEKLLRTSISSFPDHEMVEIKLFATFLDFGGFDDGFEPQLCQELVCMGAMAYDAKGLEVGWVISSTAFSR